LSKLKTFTITSLIGQKLDTSIRILIKKHFIGLTKRKPVKLAGLIF